MKINCKSKYNLLAPEQRLKITYIAWGLLIGVILIPLLLRHCLLPLYVIIAFWTLIAKKSNSAARKHIHMAGAVATLIYLCSVWLLAAGIATKLAPTAMRLQIFKYWFASPVDTIWAMLFGAGLTPYAEKVQIIWLREQILILPATYFLAYLISLRLRSENIQLTERGSARFAAPAEVGLIKNEQGFLLGLEKSVAKREVVLPLKEVCEHIVIVGSPGAGKSAGIFIPNILRMTEKDGYANMVITDPKMDLLLICGPKLIEAGYNIMIYHPYHPLLSDGWNMLYNAKDYESVDDMVVTLITNTGRSSKEGFWDDQTNTLLDLVCFHLRTVLGDRASMNYVQAIAGAFKPSDIEVMLKNSPNMKVKANAIGFFSKISGNTDLISSVMSDLPRRLKLWTIDPIRATTNVNEIDFARLCTGEKTALFVVTPLDKKEQLRPLFATFFSQLTKTVQEKGRSLGRLPRPLWFLLDEFANLGTIPGFDNFLTVVRGYNVGVTMGIQSMSQLDTLYGKDNAKTIIEACASYIISPRIGLDDAKYFSEMLGDATRRSVNKQYVKRLGMLSKLEHRETESTMARSLLNPDELRALNQNENLIVIAGTRRPVLIQPDLYFNDSRWKEVAEHWQMAMNDQNIRTECEMGFHRTNRVQPRPPLESPNEMDAMAEISGISPLIKKTGVSMNQQGKGKGVEIVDMPPTQISTRYSQSREIPAADPDTLLEAQVIDKVIQEEIQGPSLITPEDPERAGPEELKEQDAPKREESKKIKINSSAIFGGNFISNTNPTDKKTR